MDRKTVLERAFELATSGKFATVGEIKKVLRSEGYITTQLLGQELYKQLRAQMEKARRTGGRAF